MFCFFSLLVAGSFTNVTRSCPCPIFLSSAKVRFRTIAYFSFFDSKNENRAFSSLLATFPLTWVRSRWRGHWTTLANSVMDIAAANHGLLLLNGTERYARRYLLASLANSRAASPRCPPTTPRVRVEFIQNMAHIAHAKAVHGAFCSYTLLIWGLRVLIFHFNLG